MSILAFPNTVMEEIRAAIRHHRSSAAVVPLAKPTRHGASDEAVMGDDAVYRDHQATPCAGSKQQFDSWIQDLDEQTLPEMDNDELLILHALLFGAGDDAFSVADELLQQWLGSSAA